MAATVFNDKIDQGATFYRTVTLYDDAAHTIPSNLAGMTPQASLMTQAGLLVAVLTCSILTGSTIGFALSRGVTSTLTPGTIYILNLDLDYSDGVTTDRKLEGTLLVVMGQVHP